MKVRVIFDVIEMKVKVTDKINSKQTLGVKHEMLEPSESESDI